MAKNRRQFIYFCDVFCWNFNVKFICPVKPITLLKILLKVFLKVLLKIFLNNAQDIYILEARYLNITYRKSNHLLAVGFSSIQNASSSKKYHHNTIKNYYAICIILYMNFLRFFTSGTQIFNFSLNAPSLNIQPPIPIPHQKIEIQNDHFQQPLYDQPTNGINSSNQIQNMIISQQQFLNKCIKRNLQLMESQVNKQTNQKEVQSMLRKKIKKVNKCEHTDRKHYAKGLCNNCYHRIGRDKKPWKCEHETLYASGMCQNCYINRYNKMRRDQALKDNKQFQGAEQNSLRENELQKH